MTPNGKLTIELAETPQQRREYIYFQWEIYRDDPYWVPPLISEREEFLDKTRHPFHLHSDVDFFIARRDGEVVGTIAAIENKRHNQFQNENIGFFGLFEVKQDREAAEALLSTAEDWARERGLDALRGPTSFSLNEEAGLLVDGWDGPPVILMTYNPKYYVDLIEGAGYEKEMDLYAYLLELESQVGVDGQHLPPKLLRVANKIQDRIDFTVRQGKMSDFSNEAERFKAVYNSAWSNNWGFVPLTEEEKAHEAKVLKTLLDERIALFAEKDGQVIGTMLGLPDVNEALRLAYPHPNVPEWWTKIKLFWHWKIAGRVKTTRSFAGGVIPEYQGRGVISVLLARLGQASARYYKLSEISWVLESNTMMRRTAEMLKARLYRTYRIYQKPL